MAWSIKKSSTGANCFDVQMIQICETNQDKCMEVSKTIVVILLLLFLFASLTNFRTKIEETGDMRVMHSKARQSHPPDVWNSKAVQGPSQRTEIPFI